MLFEVLKQFGRKSTNEICKPGALLRADREKAEPFVGQGFLRPLGRKRA